MTAAVRGAVVPVPRDPSKAGQTPDHDSGSRGPLVGERDQLPGNQPPSQEPPFRTSESSRTRRLRTSPPRALSWLLEPLPVAEGTGTVCQLPILELLVLEQFLAIIPRGVRAGAGRAPPVQRRGGGSHAGGRGGGVREPGQQVDERTNFWRQGGAGLPKTMKAASVSTQHRGSAFLFSLPWCLWGSNSLIRWNGT